MGKFKSLNHNDVAKEFTSHGCELLDTYKYNHIPLNFICKCGTPSKKSLSNFRKKPQCKECSKLESKMKRMYPKDFVFNRLKELDCKLISDYEGCKYPIKYICPNGHEAESTFDAIHNRGHGRCKECHTESVSGENNYNWKGGYDNESIAFRKTFEFKKWKQDVHKRDNFTCQCCSKHQNELPRSSLVAHHLDGYNWAIDKRVDIDNGITLCNICHDVFHDKYGRDNNTKSQFEEFKKDWQGSVSYGNV
jgi:hypothetical protein